MRKACAYFLSAFLLLTPSLLPAQISRRDLEDINRHKTVRDGETNIIQSVEDSVQQARNSIYSPYVETWSFAEEVNDNGIEDVVPVDESTLKGRLATLPQKLLVPYNEILDAEVSDYVIRHWKSLRRILGKYNWYEAQLKAAFRSQGIPEELTALAIVESAMNPLAVSRAGAAGMWQFMEGTAKRFGLRCDSYVDERYDVCRSTTAAAKYLKSAYKHFKDWPLAISSYNCGILSVDKAVKEAGSTDFWEVYPYLPEETKGYLPAFLAALYTLKYHEEHRISPQPYNQQRSTAFLVERSMTYTEVMRATDASLEDLVSLNPQYLRGYIPGSAKKKYVLRIPTKYAKQYKDNIGLIN